MTCEERLARFCKEQCIDREWCEYRLCNKTYRCGYLSGIMYGWELGQKDTLDEITKSFEEGGIEAVVNKINELNSNGV